MKISPLIAALCLASAGPACAGQARTPHQQVSQTEVDVAVRVEMTRQHIQGLALGVIRDGQIVLAKGYGDADVGTEAPVTIETVFSIGSLSKQFLAAATMLLVEDRRVDLDASIIEYLPDAPPTWRAITVRNLLNHTSGLMREGPAFRPDRTVPDIEIVRSAYASPLLFSPGDRFEYSNLGYFVIAEVISRRSGVPWPDFVKARIFDQAGMTASGLTSAEDRSGKRARGHEWVGGEVVPIQPMAALRPSGAFVSSLADLMRWDNALDGDVVLSPTSRQTMWSAARFTDGTEGAYGLGWRVEQINGLLEIGHGGSIPGFRSYYARFPQERLSVIVLTNEGDDDPRMIAHAVAQRYLSH